MQFDVLGPEYPDDLQALWQALRAERPHLNRIAGAQLLQVSEHALLYADTRCRRMPLNDAFAGLYRDLSKLGPVQFRLHTDAICHEVIGPLGLCHEQQPQVLLCEGHTRISVDQAGWKHGVAVTEQGWHGEHHSLQFFDEAGRLCHTVERVAATDRAAWRALLLRYAGSGASKSRSVASQGPALEVAGCRPLGRAPRPWVDCEQLRAHWFANLGNAQQLSEQFGLAPLEVVSRLGSDVAQRISLDWLPGFCAQLARLGVRLQVVVGSGSVQQQHLAIPGRVSLLSHWLNLQQAQWNLHVKLQPESQLWLVRGTPQSPWEIRLYGSRGELLLSLLADAIEAGQQWMFQACLQQLLEAQSDD